MSEKKYAERIPALLDEEPITFYPNLAVVFGVNEAIVLQQIYFYMNVNRKKRSNRHFRNNKWWVYNSYKQWIDEHFPWLSLRGLQTVILGLEKRGVILSMQGVENPRDRRKWYSIDLEAMHVIVQNRAMHDTKNVSWDDTENVPSNAQEMCDEYTENTTETTSERKETTISASAESAGSTSPDNWSIADEAGDAAMFPVKGKKQISAQAENGARRLSKATDTPTHPLPLPAPANELEPTPHEMAAAAITGAKKGKGKTGFTQDENRAMATALGEAWGVAPVGDDFSLYIKKAQKLVNNGVPVAQFKKFCDRVKAKAGTYADKLTIAGITEGGRISDFVGWYADEEKKERALKEAEERLYEQYPEARPSTGPIEYMSADEVQRMMDIALRPPTRQENAS